MTTYITIYSPQGFDSEYFLRYADIPTLTLYGYTKSDEEDCWFFMREGISTTLYMVRREADAYELHIDNLAAYDDLRLFPYIADTLAKYLGAEISDIDEGQSIYDTFDEEWVEEIISEEVAMLKGTLTIVPRYYLSLPFTELSYVSQESLYEFGVSLHSSTPRIYGYLQYMMRHNLLPSGELTENLPEEECIEVDIPQHVPIGRVKSWQLDGCETYETYSHEDVQHLLALAREHNNGKPLHGVVLNDIGTLYHEGVGIPADGNQAVYWFGKAIEAGDHLYAPTNMGDLYRKGCEPVKPSLKEALAAYRKSTDPYAHYRIGQSYEEGWCNAPDLAEAMRWYRLAANEGHHWAIKRLKKEEQ